MVILYEGNQTKPGDRRVPGGPVRHRFHFTLDGDKIAALTICG
jgi:hypothetical protein